jgi:hypothetical protein
MKRIRADRLGSLCACKSVDPGSRGAMHARGFVPFVNELPSLSAFLHARISSQKRLVGCIDSAINRLEGRLSGADSAIAGNGNRRRPREEAGELGFEPRLTPSETYDDFLKYP